MYPIDNHNWRNINTIYEYNKTSNKRNILTVKQNTWEVDRAKDLSAPRYIEMQIHKVDLTETVWLKTECKTNSRNFKMLNAKYSFNKLHGYTVHQQYPTLYFPTNEHNVKKRRVIKTF